jgi:hypothetical protein
MDIMHKKLSSNDDDDWNLWFYNKLLLKIEKILLYKIINYKFNYKKL